MLFTNKALSTLAAAGIAAASLVTVAPTASAAGCVRSGVTTGFLSPGTVVHKSNSGCRDLNVTYANDTSDVGWDSYAGFYRDAYGYWNRGSRGYVTVEDGWFNPGDFILVTDLTSGREFSVASLRNGGDYVEIAH
ncbi:hypothetical protein ACFZCG_08435 [Streptomyces tanashiensis]|uniref:hypothetical protein n=1 Tax=Streptomyces tanashiensis TaxID=67367 RepID=UPI0036E7DD9B